MNKSVDISGSSSFGTLPLIPTIHLDDIKSYPKVQHLKFPQTKKFMCRYCSVTEEQVLKIEKTNQPSIKKVN